MRTFFALMSKTRNPEATREEIVQKKDGFVLYKRRCKLVQHYLNNEELGELFRGLIDYVHNVNPTFSTKVIEAYYNIMVDDVEEMNEKYVSESRRRAKWYADQKKKSQNQNSADENDKNVKDVKNVKNAEDVKNRIDIDKDIAVGEGTAQGEGTASASAQIENTLTNISNSKKEYNNNHIFLQNKEYTRRYLAEKKIFLKPSAFDAFFDYNVSIGFPYKPDTAAKRWIKKNPEDEQKPVTKKEAPQPPTTPPDLVKFREDLLEAVRPFVGAVDFKTWIEPVQVFKIQQNMNNTFDIALSVKSKFFAQHLKQHFECEIADAFKILKGVEPCIYYTFPDGYELKTFQPGKLKCLAKS